MVSRRAVLSCLSGAMVGLAGCSTDEAPRNGSPRAPEDDSLGASGSVQDPEIVTVRNTEQGHVIVQGDDRFGASSLITDPTWIDSVEFADGVPDEQAESAREYARRTDFSESTIYLHGNSISSCERLEIKSVEWGGSRISVSYCWVLRPPDVPCQPDTRNQTVTFVRLPDPLNPEALTSYGGHGTTCSGRRYVPDYETIDPEEEEGEDDG